MIPYSRRWIARHVGWEVIFNGRHGRRRAEAAARPEPDLAGTLARGGLSTADVKRRLFELDRIPAWKFDRYIGGWNNSPRGGRRWRT